MISLYPSIDEIKKHSPLVDEQSIYARLWARSLSYYVSWILIRLGLSANMVTYFSILFGLLGCLLMCYSSSNYSLIASILFNVWVLLDCVDGTIARCQKSTSYGGEFTDAVGGYIMCAFFYVSLGYHVDNQNYYNIEESLFGIDYLLLGSIVSICIILSKLIFQKYFNVKSIVAKKDVSSGKNNNLFLKFDLNIGISGLFLPLVVVASVANKLHYVILFYCIYSISSCVFITVWFLYKAKKI